MAKANLPHRQRCILAIQNAMRVVNRAYAAATNAAAEAEYEKAFLDLQKALNRLRDSKLPNPKKLRIVRGDTDVAQVQGVNIRYPRHAPKEPSAAMQRVIIEMQNAKGWKYPTKKKVVADLKLANRIAEALEFYLGGAEILDLGDGRYQVSSLGYYHYIGA